MSEETNSSQDLPDAFDPFQEHGKAFADHGQIDLVVSEEFFYPQLETAQVLIPSDVDPFSQGYC
jgi:hypothetical protein